MDVLEEILNYYKDTYSVNEDLTEIYEELIANDVEVRGDSFYCPIRYEQYGITVLLAGTKDKADMWVLKKIIKLIKTGTPMISILNGNTYHLLKVLQKYNVKVLEGITDDNTCMISFNLPKGFKWQ